MTTVPDHTKSRMTAMTAVSQMEPTPVTNAPAPMNPIPPANQQRQPLPTPTNNQSMMQQSMMTTPMDSYDSEEPCDWGKVAFYVGLLPATLIIFWFGAFSFHVKPAKAQPIKPAEYQQVQFGSPYMWPEIIFTAIVVVCCVALSPAIKSIWLKLLSVPTLGGAALYFINVTAMVTKTMLKMFKDGPSNPADADDPGFAKAVLIVELIVVALLALSCLAVAIIGFVAYSNEFTSEQPQPMEQSSVNIGGWDGYNYYRSSPYMLSANGQGLLQNTPTNGAWQQQKNTQQPTTAMMMPGNSKAYV